MTNEICCAECGAPFKDQRTKEKKTQKHYFCSLNCLNKFRTENIWRGVRRDGSIFSEYHSMKQRARTARQSIDKTGNLSLFILADIYDDCLDDLLFSDEKSYEEPDAFREE